MLVPATGELSFAEVLSWVNTQTTDFSEVDLHAEHKEVVRIRKRGPEPADQTARIDLPDVIAKLPIKFDSESAEARIKLFKSMDFSNNGLLSLSEVDSGLRRHMKSAGSKIVGSLFPAVKQAFNAARDSMPDSKKGGSENVSMGEEFRRFLVCRSKCRISGDLDALAWLQLVSCEVPDPPLVAGVPQAFLRAARHVRQAGCER
eukprot:2193132-Prymnesium_polylepis.1